jgi:hypothetical protein
MIILGIIASVVIILGSAWVVYDIIKYRKTYE